MFEGGGSNNDEYATSGAEVASLNSSISVDNILNISSNISGRNTDEKISGDTDEHYLPQKYLFERQ